MSNNFKYTQLEKVAIQKIYESPLFLAKFLGYDKFQNPDPIYYKWEDEITDTNYHRRLLLKPRNTFKTTFYSVIYPAWRLIKDPTLRIIFIGRTVRDSKTIIQEIRDCLLNPKLEKLFKKQFLRHNDYAGTAPPDQLNLLQPKDTKYKKRGANVLALGETSSITGKHCEILIFDDYCDEHDSHSNLVRRKRIELFKRHLKVPEDHPDRPGEILVVGTRKHPFDLYNHIEKEMNSEDNDWLISVETPYYPDHSLRYPTFLNERILEQNKREMGSTVFAHEMMNLPMDESNIVFHQDVMQFYDRRELIDQIQDEAFLNHYRVFAYLDLAISTKEKADYNALTIGAVQTDIKGIGKVDDIFILDGLNIKDLPDRVFKKVYDTINPYLGLRYNKFYSLTIEDNGFQKTWIDGFKRWMDIRPNYIRIPVRAKKNYRDKHARILAVQPDFESGRLQFPPYSTWKSTFRKYMEELLIYPGGDHDDCPDSLAGLISAIGRKSRIKGIG